MKVLVTGAMGFIGSNIAARLVHDGHEVFCLDNLHTGLESNVSDIRSKIKFFHADAGDVSKLGEKFDAIIHEGVYSSSPMYKNDPQLVARAISDWISILEYTRKNGNKLVYATTSSIYNGQKPPHREDMPVAVTDYYSEARYAMERLAKLYTDLYGIKVVGLRYFSIYGPHELSKGQYANLVSQFLWDLKAGRSPLIFGDGSQSRDFVYVDDVVEANMLALKHGRSDTFNVGCGKMANLNEVISILNKKLGTNIKPNYQPNKIKNYVQETLADTSKSSSILGFTAKVSLEDGIDRLVKYYKDVKTP
ncbi:NAD-dependent epimerase/dehydratase family protein [Candidatus Micrarchaeota archaeon]|nr:NAD-dependent epimerase/dehydratase family protein [Candidatus Micrarchaeota archaeon]